MCKRSVVLEGECDVCPVRTSEWLEAELKRRREYCSRMMKALTPKNGKTPVDPLRRIVCDGCGKPFVLEPSNLEAPSAPAGLAYSFVLGHCTFLEETNGTFRAYHGWPERGCVTKEVVYRREWKRGLAPVLLGRDPGLGVNYEA